MNLTLKKNASCLDASTTIIKQYIFAIQSKIKVTPVKVSS